MKRRDIVIGLIVVAVLAGIVFLIRRNATPQLSVDSGPSVEERLSDAFNLEIPADVERAELADVSSGTGSGIATRDFDGTTFTHMILADLADPDAGAFYEGWLVRGEEGDEDFDAIPTGRLRVAKGGFMLEFTSTTDLSDYQGVVVTIETVADGTPEEHVLEGTFE